jgi:hypothetical protein
MDATAKIGVSTPPAISQSKAKNVRTKLKMFLKMIINVNPSMDRFPNTISHH